MKNSKQLELKLPSVQICLKLKPSLHDKLKKISTQRGESVQKVITTLAEGKELKPQLLDPENNKKCLTELKRIGNNVNQIARKVNSGYQKDWHTSIQFLSTELKKITELLTYHVAS